MKPISVQLYSLREEAKKDFVGVLRQVAAMGYKGVEPAGLFGLDPGEARKIIEDMGMVISSNHGPWPSRDNLPEVIDVFGALGLDLVICGYGPSCFGDVESIRAAADDANFIIDKLQGAGMKLAVHNHWWEFNMIDGRLAYDIFMELCPNMLCQIDTDHAANFGACDPVEQVAKYKSRIPILHLKDGTLIEGEAFMAIGSGKIDIPGCIKAADENVLQWLVVEIDNCDTDMFQAVARSYTYLTSNGLAEGNI